MVMSRHVSGSAVACPVQSHRSLMPPRTPAERPPAEWCLEALDLTPRGVLSPERLKLNSCLSVSLPVSICTHAHTPTFTHAHCTITLTHVFTHSHPHTPTFTPTQAHTHWFTGVARLRSCPRPRGGSLLPLQQLGARSLSHVASSLCVCPVQ